MDRAGCPGWCQGYCPGCRIFASGPFFRPTCGESLETVSLASSTSIQASIATDGRLRIHTSLDPSLNDWSTAHDVYVPSLPPPGSNEEAVPPEGASSGTGDLANGQWGLSWCKERWWGSILAAFAGTVPTVKVRLIPHNFRLSAKRSTDHCPRSDANLTTPPHPSHASLSPDLRSLGIELRPVIPSYSDWCSGRHGPDMASRAVI